MTKQQELVSMVLLSKNVSVENIDKLFELAKYEGLKITSTSNYIYISKSGKTMKLADSYFKQMMINKETYEFFKKLFPNSSTNFSKMISGNGNSAKFKYTATANICI